MVTSRCKYGWWYVLMMALVPVIAHAQSSKTDSLILQYQQHLSDTSGVKILNDLEYEYELSDFSKARAYIKKAYRLAHQLKWNKGIALTLGNMGWMYKNNFQADSALIYQRELSLLGQKTKNHDWMSTAYTILGSIRHSKNQYREAIKAYTNAWQESEKDHNSEAMAIAFNNTGNIYEDMGNFDTAIYYFNKSLQIRIKNNNKPRQLDTYTNIAVAYVRQGKYDKAIEIFLNNSLEYEKLNNYLQVANNYANASVVYDEMHDNAKALTYSLKALENYKKTTNIAQIALITNNVGVHYEHSGNPDKALKYYEESKALHEKINNEKGIATELNNIGSILQIKGKHKEALRHFYQALALKKKNNEVNTLGLTYHNIATGYLALKQPDSALVNLGKSEKISQAFHYLPDLKNCYKTYCDVYEQKGDYQKALTYYKLYHQYSDSLIDTEKAKRVTELEAIFESNKKELDNKRLVIKNQQEKIARIEAEEKSARRTKQVYLVLSIAIFLIAVLWIVYQYRRRKLKDRFNRLLIEEKEEGIKAIFTATEEERKRIAKDLHDGIGQQMSGLKLAWQSVSSDISQTHPQEKERLHKLTAVLDETSKEIREISHRMMPRVLTEMGLKEAIEDMLKKTLEHSSIQYQFESFGFSGQRFDEKIEISLYRICQELVNNVVKHAHAHHLSVQLILKDPYMVLIVEDDGKGFDSQKKQAGIGLMNISSRVNTVNGKINYEASQGAGTVATVRVPVKPR